tara:strand:+ start:3259 stop:4434 length:1176 start_codon:yes stop_codon:yes gene_type:complete
MEKTNAQHTVIIPSYNTVEHLKNTYKSLKRYAPLVSIIIIDDASEDGTAEWLDTITDNKLTSIISKERRGHTYWYDEGMRRSKTDIVSILHSDMIIGPNYFENMLKHLQPGKVVCATRIEPPIHPAGKEKIVQDFGDEADNIKWEQFDTFVLETINDQKDQTTRGIFAPWMLYKQDHFDIGGHDQRFTPFGYEDSDIFNRWILAGYEMIQSRDALCYHLTCRGHRWNKGVGIENPDYEQIMLRCRRDFIRKWGDWIQNDDYQYPIINPKYQVGIVVENCYYQLIQALEPWCSYLYVDLEEFVLYGGEEQKYSSFNIDERVKGFDPNKYVVKDNITVKINGDKFTQQDFQTIQQLSAIIQDSGEIGEFELGNLKIQINDLTTYENKLVNYER